jgi:hypothetical protein
MASSKSVKYLLTRYLLHRTHLCRINNEKKQKAMHDPAPAACRSKMYVFYDVFKEIFCMLMLGFKLMILGFHGSLYLRLMQ